MAESLFDLDFYVIRRKVLKLFGASFHVYDQNDSVVGFSKQKAFKLKEDIRVYAGEAMEKELLGIFARKIVDFSSAYDMIDGESGAKIGAARRKGWSSMFRDSWEVLDADDEVIGQLKEDSTLKALFRRFFSNLIPQKFYLDDGSGSVVAFRQRWNPFVYKLEVTIPEETTIDSRVIFGTATLLASIEGRQKN